MRILKPLMTTAGLAALTIGCASGLPAVISSTQEKVAVEFDTGDGLSGAAALARDECGKRGKVAEYHKVDVTSTPTSRIVRYNCVSTEAR